MAAVTDTTPFLTTSPPADLACFGQQWHIIRPPHRQRRRHHQIIMPPHRLKRQIPRRRHPLLHPRQLLVQLPRPPHPHPIRSSPFRITFSSEFINRCFGTFITPCRVPTLPPAVNCTGSSANPNLPKFA